MASLENLPSEILIKIFQFINDGNEFKSSKTLLNLTKICKRFNEIISSEKSLVEKFVAKFSYDNIAREWIGSRMYQHLSIECLSSDELASFVKLLKDFGSAIKTISWIPFDEELSAKTVAEVLTLCPNVKSIKYFPRLIHEAEAPELNLDYLSIYGSNSGFLVLGKTQVRRAEIYLRNSEGVQTFLERQENLKSLSLEVAGFDPVILENCLGGSFVFPLEYLKIKGNFLALSCGFAENWRKTLKEVDMEDLIAVELLSYFAECEKLEKIKFVQKENWRDEMATIFGLEVAPSVKELDLTFYEDIDLDIAEIFPNLRKLNLNNPGNRLLHELPSEFQHLEELHLNNVNTESVSKNVKTFCAYNVDFYHGLSFDDDPKVEMLLLSRCKNLSWLPKLLKVNKVPLKKIYISNVKLEMPEALALRRQARKFGNVEGIGISFGEMPEDVKERMEKTFNTTKISKK